MPPTRPANDVAVQVVRLQSENNDLAIQIGTLETKKSNNLQMIDVFSPMAEWEEYEEPVVPEPEPPVEEPEPETIP